MATINDLWDVVSDEMVEELKKDASESSDLMTEEVMAEFVRVLAQATAIEKLADAIDRFTDTYRLLKLGEDA